MPYTDPPQVVDYKPSNSRTRGNLDQEVTVKCPLVGNPPPVCSWEFHTCDLETLLDVPSGLTFNNNNCSFTIQKLTLEYRNKCFKCYARNYLGDSSRDILDITFNGNDGMHVQCAIA